MKKEQGEQMQLLKWGTGACSLSTGYALWVPFAMSGRLGGAEASMGVRLAGAFLLAAGVALLARGFQARDWKEWMKLFLFFGLLQLGLSLASGLLALLALSLSGDNGKTAKCAADLCSAALAIPLHAWTLCLAGRLSRRGRFALWFPGRLFLQFSLLCFLAALCQIPLSRLPGSTAGVLAQGLLGGGLLFGTLYWMQKLTDRQLSKEQERE